MNGFSEVEQEGEGAGPDLRHLSARGVVRSFPWVVLLVALGGAAGLVLGLLRPNRYESTAKLSLRMGAREQLTSDSLLDVDDRQRVPTPTLADELQMLSDVTLFERVAREWMEASRDV